LGKFQRLVASQRYCSLGCALFRSFLVLRFFGIFEIFEEKLGKEGNCGSVVNKLVMNRGYPALLWTFLFDPLFLFHGFVVEIKHQHHTKATKKKE